MKLMDQWKVQDALDIYEVKHWGKGYASEGARGCRDYAFSELKQDKVISIIDPRNEPSIRVAHANGMKLEKQIFIQKFNQVENIYSVSRQDVS